MVTNNLILSKIFLFFTSQFEIVDINPHFFTLVAQGFEKPKQLTLHKVNKKDPYARILIKKITRLFFANQNSEIRTFSIDTKVFIIITLTELDNFKLSWVVPI